MMAARAPGGVLSSSIDNRAAEKGAGSGAGERSFERGRECLGGACAVHWHVGTLQRETNGEVDDAGEAGARGA